MIELDKIYNEDCLIGMQRIPDGSVDCIICDLPYEVLNRGNDKVSWDNIIPLEPLWEQYLRIAKPNAAIVLFGQGMFSAKLMMSQPDLWKYNLIWEKDRPTGFLNCKKMPMRNHEDILVFYRALPTYNPQMRQGFPSHQRGHGKGNQKGNACYGNYSMEKYSKEMTTDKYPLSILPFKKEKQEGMHPTQKPVDLLRYLIRTYTNEGETVLDNCIGSGTTAIACHREKRHFIGFELNKEYYDKALKRIKLEQQQLTLF